MYDQVKKNWQKAVDFHGHECPGLALGVRVALDFKKDMGFTARAEDEELAAVVETDACAVDAIQVILGCTAGKGNLWLQRRGKHVFTLIPPRPQSRLSLPLASGRPKRIEPGGKNCLLSSGARRRTL